MNKTFLSRCMMLAMASSAVTASAQEQVSTGALSPNLITLPPITILGNNINDIDNTLPNVDVVNLNTLRNPSVNSLQDSLTKNPAVEINNSSNGSADQLRIRGFGENYTEVTLDGQKMPEYFVFGPYTSGGRGFVETDTLKQIDIIKGLHSPKQNSGALAGSVNMQTYDPSDFVDKEHPFYGSVKAGYTSKDKQVSGTATLAAAQDNLSGMLIYTHRHGHETKNMGSDATQTLRDEQKIKQQNILVKGEIGLENGNIIATGEYFDQKQHISPRYNKRAKEYTEPTKRKRFKVEGNFTNVLGLDKANIQTSINDYSQTTQVYGKSHFKQRNINLKFDGSKQLDYANMQHNILFGISYDNDKFDYKQEGRSSTIRYMPITKRDTFTLYAKDQVTFGNGLSISPGLRVSHQRLRSDVDHDYKINPALAAQGSYIPNNKTTVVTPSINAVMPIGEHSKVFASYSHGSRLADSSNIGSFDHGFGFILPNPDLKTEKSNNYEIGFNYVVPDQVEFKLTAFYSKFRDFIAFDSDGTFGTFLGRPKMVLRPFNVNKAKTYGAELELGYTINPQLYAHASVAMMRGRIGNEASHGVTLSQAYPNKAILGLSYNQGERWGADVDWTLVGKGQKPENEDKQFRTPGYGVLDVTGWWKPIDNMTVTAGIYNLGNKKYWLSSDANGLAKVSRSGQPVNHDDLTQPGRNFAVNLRYEF